MMRKRIGSKFVPISDGIAPDIRPPLILQLHCPSARVRGQVNELLGTAHAVAPEVSYLITSASSDFSEALFPDHDVFIEGYQEDTPTAATRILQSWKPHAVLMFSDALSPALITEANRRGIPVYMIADAPLAMTDSGALFKQSLLHAAVERVSHIYATDASAVQNCLNSGARAESIEMVGPLSQATLVPPGDDHEHKKIAEVLGVRPSWLAVEASQQEVPVIVKAHATSARKAHRLLLILVPEHPDYGGQIAENLSKQGWRVAQRSRKQLPEEDTQIFIADVQDEVGLWLRLSPICMIGQTIHTAAGIDPFIPASLGAVVLHGPCTRAFGEHYERLSTAGATRNIYDAKTLSDALDHALSPDKAALMAHSAWEVTTSGVVATETIVAKALAGIPGGKGD